MKSDPYTKYRNHALYPELEFKASGPAVKVLQSALASSGFFTGAIGGNFLQKTRDAVIYFQQTHINAEGNFLDPDGKVGKETWWALENPSGAAQRNRRQPESLTGLTGLTGGRLKLMEIIQREHATGIREIPDGSNWGDGVTKYLEGVGPQPWCAFSASHLFREATGSYPLGRRYGHVQTLTAALKRAGKFHAVDSDYLPIPGDFFLMHYPGSTTGHTGFVTGVSAHQKWNEQQFSTAEGNAGNRFKYGMRNRSQPTLVGFGNLFDDAGQVSFRRGIAKNGPVLGDTGNTR